jgi:predicted nucleic acid-binding protein
MKVLIDTNVLLDALLGRNPYFDYADKILELCAIKKVQGYIAAHSIPNIFYIMRKDLNESERREVLLRLCTILTVESVDSVKIIEALKDSNFHDFEDCLQSKCAECVSAEYIVTRNVKDFTLSAIPAILPKQFLELMEADFQLKNEL